MAPMPKPPEQRRRRNADQAGWRTIEADESRRIPDLPAGEWLESTVRWWRLLWTSPMAAAYVPADVDSLERLARLKNGEANGTAPAVALAAIQQLEDRFGLSPKARRALQWEVAQAGAVEAKSKPATVRRLRAVDPTG